MTKVLRTCGAGAALCLGLLQPVGAQAPLAVALPPPTAATPFMFTEVLAVRELSDGSLLVSDRREQRLSHFVWPDHAVQIGGVGEGPGEYRSAGLLLPMSGDSTLFLDPRGSRWLLLRSGQVVETMGAGRPLVAALGTAVSGVDGLGRVVGLRGRSVSGRTPAVLGLADSIDVLRADRRTAEVERIATVRGPGARGYQGIVAEGSGGAPGRIIANNPLDAADEVLVFPDGSVAVARVDPYSIDWLRPEGTWTPGVLLPAPQKELDERDRCFAVAVARLPGGGDRCDAGAFQGWPRTFPPFRRDITGRPPLIALPDGRVAVRRYPTPEDPLPRYDLVDRSGRLSGVLRLGQGEVLVGFGAKGAYTLVTTELGLQAIRLHPMAFSQPR